MPINEDEESTANNEMKNEQKNMKMINKKKLKKEIVIENLVGNSLLINRPFQETRGYVHRPDLYNL